MGAIAAANCCSNGALSSRTIWRPSSFVISSTCGMNVNEYHTLTKGAWHDLLQLILKGSTWGTALSTPRDIPTSMRHTRPLHSQFAPPSCMIYAT